MVGLHDPKTDTQIWSETFPGDVRDLLALQSDVAEAIANAIGVALSPDERTHIRAARRVDPAAFDAWLSGMRALWSRTPDGILDAIRLARLAIGLDPEYIDAYVLLSNAYPPLTTLSLAPAKLAFDSAAWAARSALALDGRNSGAYRTLAWRYAAYDWDWGAADRSFRRAIDLNRSNAEAHWSYSFFLGWIGRHREALGHANEALRLDPLNPAVAANLAEVLYLGRRFDDAIEAGRKAVTLGSGYPFAHLRLAHAFEAAGRFDDAVASYEEAHRISPDFRRRAFVARAYALAGRESDARSILAELLEVRSTSYVPPTALAAIYEGLGESQEALDWLERGFDERDLDMVLLRSWPFWDRLRAQQRFARLVREMRFPPEPG